MKKQRKGLGADLHLLQLLAGYKEEILNPDLARTTEFIRRRPASGFLGLDDLLYSFLTASADKEEI